MQTSSNVPIPQHHEWGERKILFGLRTMEVQAVRKAIKEAKELGDAMITGPFTIA
jgi:hypothetical protein